MTIVSGSIVALAVLFSFRCREMPYAIEEGLFLPICIDTRTIVAGARGGGRGGGLLEYDPVENSTDVPMRKGRTRDCGPAASGSIASIVSRVE